MTDVPPDNGASGLPPAVQSDPPVVRRSSYSEPPPGTEPPTFDDDALAEAMAAEVATYTSPITLPKVTVAPAPEVPPAPAAPVSASAAGSVAPPAAVAAADEPASTWDGRPPAEEAAASAADAAAGPFPAPAPVDAAEAIAPAPVDAAPLTAEGNDGEPSEEELRRALGGASTLETIERLEQELKHISNGEPTILSVTATPAAGVTLAVPVPAPVPAPDPAEAAASWPFPPPGGTDPEPALDRPAPGHFFPAAFEPIHLDDAAEVSPAVAATVEPPVADPAVAETTIAESDATEPVVAEPETAEPPIAEPAPVEPQFSEPDFPEPTGAPEPTAPPLGDAWAFPAPDRAPSVQPSEAARAPAAEADPLAWLAPPADSTFPPPPEAAGFAVDPPAPEAPVVAASIAPEAFAQMPEAEPAASPSAESPVSEVPAAESAAPEPAAPEPAAPEPAAPEPAAQPFAPEPPDPGSYAPYPFEVDPSLIDPVAAATVAAALPEQSAADAPAETVAAQPDPEPESPAASETPWWAVTEPTDGVWEIATPEPEVLAPLEGVGPSEAPEPEPAAPDAPRAEPEVQTAAPDAVGPAPTPVVPTPFSTEPPVGPESPDWLSAPPPVFTPPELVEPPGFVDSPPNAALDPVAPITANTLASLPMPLPTDQPNIADRAELPPPPGYEDIPIMSSDVTGPPEPVAPSAFFPAAVPVVPGAGAAVDAAPVAAAAVIAVPIAAPPVVMPSAPTIPRGDPVSPIGAPPASTERSGLDHEDDDVVDEVDRVTGTGAIPISAVGTIEPLAPPSEPIATIRLGKGQPALVDEQPKEPPAFEVEAAGPEPTPLDLRAGRAARLFWLWFAANSSVLSMGLGAVLLATGMSLRQAIVATLAGVAISFLPLGLGTLAGKWSGQPTMIVSRATFGHAGNILPALLAVLTRVLWGGVLLWLLATAVAKVLVGAGLDAGLGTTVWQLVGLVAGFVIATVIAVFGYGFVAKLQLVVSVVSGLLIVGSAALTFQHLNFAKALTVPDGNWILVVSGAALVFSVVGLAWVHSSSDLARYQRTGSSGAASMLWATFGATLPPFLLVVWGAMLSASDPALGKKLATNPLAAIASLLPNWYPAPLLVFAALGLLSGAVVTMYSGGFALQALGLKLRRNLGTLISAILVLAVSAALIFVVTDFSSLVRSLIITIAVPVAAWAGIFAAEMMIRTRPFHAPSLLAPGGSYPQLRPLNFLALIMISVIGLGLVTSSIPGLEWEGFLYGIAGIGPKDALASSDAGVFVALLLGILVPLVGGIPSIRRQEHTAVVG